MGSAVSTEGELLARDIHPAEVLLPDGRIIRDARVFVTTRRLVAWIAKPTRSVEAVLQVHLPEGASVERNMNSLGVNERLTIETDQGTVIVNKGRGCGCHSPLKALSPPVSWSGK